MANLYKKTYIFIILFTAIAISNNLSAQLLTKKSQFSSYDTLFGSNTATRACYDALHYSISLSVDLESKSINGMVAMDIEWLGGSNRLQLDLFSRYNIHSIKIDGKTATYSRDSNFVFIDIPRSWDTSSRHTILTSYSGEPIQAKKAPWDGGFVWKKASDNSHWVGVACEGLGASSWWPCKDYWGDEPDEGST